MPNGKIGDHPYTDIVIHDAQVYSRTADGLIREIHELGGHDEIYLLLWNEFHPYNRPDVQRLEGVLTEIRDRLRSLRKE